MKTSAPAATPRDIVQLLIISGSVRIKYSRLVHLLIKLQLNYVTQTRSNLICILNQMPLRSSYHIYTRSYHRLHILVSQNSYHLKSKRLSYTARSTLSIPITEISLSMKQCPLPHTLGLQGPKQSRSASHPGTQRSQSHFVQWKQGIIADYSSSVEEVYTSTAEML
jgi:hypothetical protein